jgi:hypothetical protein
MQDMCVAVWRGEGSGVLSVLGERGRCVAGLLESWADGMPLPSASPNGPIPTWESGGVDRSRLGPTNAFFTLHVPSRLVILLSVTKAPHDRNPRRRRVARNCAAYSRPFSTEGYAGNVRHAQTSVEAGGLAPLA